MSTDLSLKPCSRLQDTFRLQDERGQWNVKGSNRRTPTLTAAECSIIITVFDLGY